MAGYEQDRQKTNHNTNNPFRRVSQTGKGDDCLARLGYAHFGALHVSLYLNSFYIFLMIKSLFLIIPVDMSNTSGTCVMDTI